MCAVVGTGAVEHGHQVARQVGDRDDADVVGLVRGRAVDVAPGGYPRIPRAAVEQRVPRVVGVVVGLGSLFPARGHRDLDHRVALFDVVHQLRIHVVGAGRGRQETEYVLKLAEDLVDDPALVLHREEPDRQLLGRELLPELGALQAQEGRSDLVAVLRVVLFGDRHGLLVEEARVGHLDRRPDAVLVGDALLGAEDVQRFADDGAAREVLGLALLRPPSGGTRAPSQAGGSRSGRRSSSRVPCACVRGIAADEIVRPPGAASCGASAR